MSKVKKIICFKWKNKFNIHNLIVEDIARVSLQYGIKTEVFELGFNDFLAFYKNNGYERDDSLVINWGPYISVALNGLRAVPKSKRERIYEKSMFILEDHPFASWVSRDIMGFSCPHTFLGLHEARSFIELMNDKIHFFSRDFIYRKPILKEDLLLKDRYVDVLIAMDFRKDVLDISKINNLFIGSDFSILAEHFYALYEKYIYDLNMVLYDEADKVLSSIGLSMKVIAQDNKLLFQKVLDALHIIDMNIRRRRRLNLVKRFISEYGSLKTIICAYPHDLDFEVNSPNVTFIGPVDHKAYHGLLSVSKYNLFSNPTYKDHLNQRVNDSVSFGCATICDESQALKNLINSKDLSLFTLDSLSDVLKNQDELPLRVVNTYVKIKESTSLSEFFISYCQNR